MPLERDDAAERTARIDWLLEQLRVHRDHVHEEIKVVSRQLVETAHDARRHVLDARRRVQQLQARTHQRTKATPMRR